MSDYHHKAMEHNYLTCASLQISTTGLRLPRCQRAFSRGKMYLVSSANTSPLDLRKFLVSATTGPYQQLIYSIKKHIASIAFNDLCINMLWPSWMHHLLNLLLNNFLACYYFIYVIFVQFY